MTYSSERLNTVSYLKLNESPKTVGNVQDYTTFESKTTSMLVNGKCFILTSDENLYGNCTSYLPGLMISMDRGRFVGKMYGFLPIVGAVSDW